MTDRSDVCISATSTSGGYALLVATGTLDSATYHHVRDSVIKAALDEPTAVLVEVSELDTPADTAWTVFTSARWHVSIWPDVPVILISRDPERRAAVARSGATRYVPVYADEAAAVQSLSVLHRLRRRARAELSVDTDSLRQARRLLSEWLTAWAREDLILTASTVATVLVDNVLTHTSSTPVLALEQMDGAVTVAVSDGDAHVPVRHEDSQSGAHTVSGLAIVAALSRAWGCSPTADGKTVWALVGPDNAL